jgi:predicted N-acyltransferase
MSFDIRIVHSVTEIGQPAWDSLGGDQPFASYAWYRFGETVMSGCTPVYILLAHQGINVARATFWVIRDEPLPLPWRPLRETIQAALRRWPLFICRSPLANAPGLILPEPPLRRPALEALARAARAEALKYHASFQIFDYMEAETTRWGDWPEGFSFYEDSDPGTRMEIGWKNFEQYMKSLSPKARKHYRRYNREADQLGIRIRQQDSASEDEIDAAIPLIREVERRHDASPNPWTRKLLENFKQIGATWLTARINDRIVGCELILEDRGTQMVTSLGLARDVFHVYFLLGYADIQDAIAKGVRTLRWGSGAYEYKQRLGFQLEANNHIIFAGMGPVSRTIARLAGN